MATQLRLLDYTGKEPLKAYTEEVMAFFDDITKQWDEPEKGGIISAVLNANIDGQKIEHKDALAYLWILFTGALDTTAHASTIGMLSLFHHPDQLNKLRSDLSLMPTAVEEFLRWSSTSNVVKHVAVVDTVLGGKAIKAGDFVATYLPSANRDERAFTNPYCFDIARKKESSIFTFGGGPHVCLGQHFARLELRILFEELLKRFPKVSQIGPAVRGEAFTSILSPVNELPVRLVPTN